VPTLREPSINQLSFTHLELTVSSPINICQRSVRVVLNKIPQDSRTSIPKISPETTPIADGRGKSIVNVERTTGIGLTALTAAPYVSPNITHSKKTGSSIEKQVNFSSITAARRRGSVVWSYLHGEDVNQSAGVQIYESQCPSATFEFRDKPPREPPARCVIEVSAYYSVVYRNAAVDWFKWKRNSPKFADFLHVLEMEFPTKQTYKQQFEARQTVEVCETRIVQGVVEGPPPSDGVSGKPLLRRPQQGESLSRYP
jgi:hypothetical protein